MLACYAEGLLEPAIGLVDEGLFPLQIVVVVEPESGHRDICERLIRHSV